MRSMGIPGTAGANGKGIDLFPPGCRPLVFTRFLPLRLSDCAAGVQGGVQGAEDAVAVDLVPAGAPVFALCGELPPNREGRRADRFAAGRAMRKMGEKGGGGGWKR